MTPAAAPGKSAPKLDLPSTPRLNNNKSPSADPTLGEERSRWRPGAGGWWLARRIVQAAPSLLLDPRLLSGLSPGGAAAPGASKQGCSKKQEGRYVF